MTTNKEKISDIGGALLDAVFPPRCAICDKIIHYNLKHICEDCEKIISYVEEPRCLKCGKHIISSDEEYCYDCGRKERDFIKGYPLFNYVSPVSDSLMAMKYHGRQEYAEYYGTALFRKFGKEFKSIGVEAIVPVPIYKKKYATRGYNQAELIARVLGIRLRKKVRRDIIMRVEDTPPQKELSSEARDKNMKRAFKSCNQIKKLPECVLLVDDIYTTGSTIQACTKACHEAGVKKVYYTSVAIGSV